MKVNKPLVFVVGLVCTVALIAFGVDNQKYSSGGFAGDGSGLTNIYASNIISGGQLPLGTVATNTGWNGSHLGFSNQARVWTQDGGGLTNLNASALASGTVPLAQLPSFLLTNQNQYQAIVNGGVLLSNNSSTISAGLSTTASNLFASVTNGGRRMEIMANPTNRFAVSNNVDGVQMLSITTNGAAAFANGNATFDASGDLSVPNGTRTTPSILFGNNTGNALYYNASSGGPASVGTLGSGGNLVIGGGASLQFNSANDFSGQWQSAMSAAAGKITLQTNTLINGGLIIASNTFPITANFANLGNGGAVLWNSNGVHGYWIATNVLAGTVTTNQAW